MTASVAPPHAGTIASVRQRRLVAALLLAGWLVSLALPAIGFRVDSDGKPTEGIVALLGGWVVVGGWPSHPAYPAALGWFANFGFLTALALIIGRQDAGRRRALGIAGALTLFFALLTLDLLLRPHAKAYEIHLQVFSDPFHYSANGVAIGYYVWLAATLLAGAAAIVFSKAAQDQ